ncbi:MAG: patatin-like phospholipase family protein [Acidobacteriia bacterium]|nr:patatin-like phospholipase family protein [Terriglobia bacterium]
MAERYLNLVFQGGGVRGIAYAGALHKMPPDYKLHTVAGASAGSIVAALLAIGKRPADIKQVLSDPELFALIEPEESKRATRLGEAFSELAHIFPPSGGASWTKVPGLLLKHSNLFRDLGEVMGQRGLHRTTRLRSWLDKITEGKTFSQAKACEQLKIVAADVTRREYRILSKANWNDRPIAEAVHASCSIPVFFHPFSDGASFLVDGGLLSNFPSFLVGRGDFPTIGLRLDDFLPPPKISGPLDYLKSLILTMTEAHDKLRDSPPNFKSYPIYTAEIPSTKFDLSGRDLETLFQLGVGVGNEIDWLKYSAEKPEVSYYDTKPQLSLDMSLRQAHALWRSFSDQQMWLDELKHDLTYTVRIEKDWSASYDRLGITAVGGKSPFFVSIARLVDPASELGSLYDVEYTAEELDPHSGVATPLIAIPAFNGQDTKGFLLFFTPPIAPGNPRTIRTRFRVPGEFSQTLAKGHDDEVFYSSTQIAHDHQIRLHFCVLVDRDLPELVITSEFGSKFVQQADQPDPNTQRFYRRYDSQLGWTHVGGNARFTAKVSRK